MKSYRIVVLDRKDYYPKRHYYYTMVSGIEPDKVSVIWSNNPHNGFGQATYSLSKMDTIIKKKLDEKEYSIVSDVILTRGDPVSVVNHMTYSNAVFCHISVTNKRYPRFCVLVSTEHDYLDQREPRNPLYRKFNCTDISRHHDSPDFTTFSDQIRFPVLHKLCNEVRESDLSGIEDIKQISF